MALLAAAVFFARMLSWDSNSYFACSNMMRNTGTHKSTPALPPEVTSLYAPTAFGYP